jgi:hypothetical protein
VPSFDPRILRIGIEVDGQLNVYDGLWATATISKFANPLQNEAEVKITNLSREVRDYLLTETSPFNQSKKPKRITIEAGRESTGAARLFIGDITECTPSQPPDITLTLKAKTKQADKGLVVAASLGAQEKLSVAAAGVAASLGLSLVFEAADKNIANYSFTGGALKQVAKLGEAGNVNAYVDDDRLVVKDYNVPLKQTTSVLSATSGLIGIPELTEQGVKVKYLLDPKAALGGELELETVIYKAVNGKYVIYKLSYELASRDTAWYCIAECKRKGAK